MRCLHHIVLLLMCTPVLCHYIGLVVSHYILVLYHYGTDGTYQELVDLLNGTCSKPVPCIENPNKWNSGQCDCGPSCSWFGTCCADSPNRWTPPPKVLETCRRTVMSLEWNAAYFMVAQCPQHSDGSKSEYADVCREEWNGQNDVNRLVPVTSLATHVTYKNHFCFRCHESGGNPLFWDTKVFFDGNNTDVEEDFREAQLEYINGTWRATVGPGYSQVPVIVFFTPPEFIVHSTYPCIPDLISKCSENWHDESARAKCGTYLYQTIIHRDDKIVQYRNPHCALCNYESLDKLYCPPTTFAAYDPATYAFDPTSVSSGRKRIFTITSLVDINPSSGNIVGKIQNCSGNEKWDFTRNKCSLGLCHAPTYIAENGKCVPP